MMFEMTGVLSYIRVLSFQLTGHVVWLSQEPAKGMIQGSRVPMCVPGLDYVTYAGRGPADIQTFYGALKNYQLVCSMSRHPIEFDSEPLPYEFVDRIRLYRIKCYAVQSIQNTVSWAMEKNGLYMNPLIDSSLDFDRLSAIHARQHNLSKPISDKLLKFKFDEHCSGVETLKYIQIEAELAVTNANSIPQVSDVYKNFLTAMGMARATDDSIMRFM